MRLSLIRSSYLCIGIDTMRKIFYFLSFIILSLLVTGCSFLRMDFHPIKEDGEALAARKKQQHSYNPAHYPVTIKTINSKGQLVDQTFTKPPERIVAMWQNSIETPLALGVGNRIMAGVGVPDKKYFRPEYQEEYSKIPIQGSRELDVETTMMQEPEIIIGWFSTFDEKVLRSTEFWKKRGVHTYTAISSSPLNRYRKLEHEWQDIENLGVIFDRRERAQEIINNMKKEIQLVVSKTAKQPRKPRALIVEYQGKEVRVFGERSLAGDITKCLNGEILAATETNISLEQIVDMDPDVIFTLVCEWDYGREDKIVEYLTKNPAMSHLRCVENKRVVPLHLGSVYAAGVRSLDGIHTIAQGLYPELDLRRER